MISKCDIDTDNIETDTIIIINSNDSVILKDNEDIKEKQNSFSINKMNKIFEDDNDFENNNF